MMLLFTSLIYLMLILFLPTFYYNYQVNKINDSLEDVYQAAKTNNLDTLEKSLDAFNTNTNITPILIDSNGKIIYIPYVTVQPDTSDEAIIGSTTVNEDEDIEIKTITCNNQDYVLYYASNIQQIDDVSFVLIQFAPYFLLFAIIISLLVSYFFSRKTVRPLQEMNQVASQMVQLDFHEKLAVHSEDEIGELSNNLNKMAYSLEKALTELQTANSKLKDEIEKEREIEQLRKNFVMAVSHELKSPLAAVMGLVEAMQYNIPPYDNHTHYLPESYRVLEQMAKLIQEMIEVSNIDQPDYIDKKETVDLSQLTKSILLEKQVHPDYNLKKIQLAIDSDILITANPKSIEKVLQNIIGNAFQYSTDEAEIIISVKKTASGWKFSIYNETDPIPEKEIVNLFQPFYRLEKSGNKVTGGNGLGLFITTRLLEVQGFSYSFKNEQNGVVFTFWQ
ncbi:sensor histidine kinase [Listeria ilorinensis]|uniref:sensor histidine kinase n=1 Tax=Listeria ilorinensis TaxID=2867439 RepID=UPI001EF40D77|nr:HAMP domain-containing sensor histidine kinase [Listeria ilorinensis]